MIYKSIILVGVGQIGSRHLQGLAKSKFPIKIEVVDPSPDSLRIAEQRYYEVVLSDSQNIVNFRRGFESVDSKEFDLAIIATNSDIRQDIVDSMLMKFKVKYLILEKVAYQSEQIFTEQIAKIDNYGVKAWVNCPRRVYPFYMELKKELETEDFSNMIVNGGNWGLGCNSIHYLDIFAFLTGDNRLELDYYSLDNEILQSKRGGFLEFTGNIELSNSKGKLCLIANAKSEMPVQILITASKRRYIINESNNDFIVQEFDNKNMRIESEVRFPFQSDLTGDVAFDLINMGKCGLTTLEESYKFHTIILNLLNLHLSFVNVYHGSACPIT